MECAPDQGYGATYLVNLVSFRLQRRSDVQGIAAPCLLAAGRDEAAQDSVLSYATEALLRTHTRFYQKLLACSINSAAYRSTSVCNVMAEELSTILKDCKLLLASCTSSLKVRQPPRQRISVPMPFPIQFSHLLRACRRSRWTTCLI